MDPVRQSLIPALCAATFCLAPGSVAVAQQATIQQPTVGVFSGSGTVSVPNRGRTVIGGVSRGASSRSTYGPFPVGTNTGRSFEGGSVSVSAYIHDFEELDRQALSAAESTAPTKDRRSGNERANRAYDSLMSRDREVPARSKVAVPKVVKDDKDRGLTSEELFDRGRKAEAAGQSGVALAFYRQSRDRGLAEAGREHDRLQKSRR